MKKMLLTVVFLLGLGAALFAWEPEDLTKYPSFTDQDDWILNLGIGLDGLPPTLGSDYIWIPPLRLSFDKNVPIGDKQLPFFIGGIVGFWGHGYTSDPGWFYSVLSLGARFGYHFNWDVDKLDTYAVSTLGWKLYLGDKDYRASSVLPMWVDVNLGARYFPLDWFGFWAEAGFGASIFNFNLGVSFKF